MKENIRDYCKMCATCALHRSENIKFERKVFHPSLLPMDFICMDLIGEFHPPTSHGHHYALTAVCMLTGFTWCIPLKSKKADEVAKAYLDHIYSLFGGSVKILMDNRTEFKNQLFKEVVSKLVWLHFGCVQLLLPLKCIWQQQGLYVLRLSWPIREYVSIALRNSLLVQFALC